MIRNHAIRKGEISRTRVFQSFVPKSHFIAPETKSDALNVSPTTNLGPRLRSQIIRGTVLNPMLTRMMVKLHVVQLLLAQSVNNR